ncbi:MAG: cellulose binding domain-containing protein [Clostridiaceae bacterium]
MFKKCLKTMLLYCAMIICSLFFINTTVNAAGTTGWVYSSNTWYYYQNGAKVVNSWKADSNGWCYLGADGACVKNSIQADSNGRCYIGADGYWSKGSTWRQDSITKNWFFIGTDGYAVKSAWVRDSQGWCYLGADGAWVTSGWAQDSKGWCYINAYGYWDGLAQVATIPTTKAIYTDAANKTSYNLANASNFTLPTITATINGQAVTVTPVITNSNGEIINVIDTAKADTYTIRYTAKGADNSYIVTATVASAALGRGGGSSVTVVRAIGAISGTARVGFELTAGALTPAGATVTYQWKICDTIDGTYTDIAGATANNYIPAKGDVGKFIKVSATGKGSYSGTITSAATLPCLSGVPSIAVSLAYLVEKGLITEGAEDSRILTVSLSNDTFVQADVTTGNITITGLPTGVTVGSVDYINPTIILITLAGNSTTDYDTNITATVNIASAALTLGGADITADIGFTAVVETALDAPTAAVVDDSNDTIGWTNNATQINAADYEYSVDSGSNWTTCTANPQTGIIGGYATGVVQVRAKATLRNPASAALVSTALFNPLVTVAVSNGSTANTIGCAFTITNTSSYALELTTLKLNYYYTTEGNKAQTFTCDYAAITSGEYKTLNPSSVVGNIYTLSPTTSTADTYLQVSFTAEAGSLAAGQSMTVKTRVNKTDWTNYDQSNDYSNNASNNVTAYVNGVKIFGTAP